MQTTMPSQKELALFIKNVFLAMQSNGESAHERFQKDEPVLYALAAAQLDAIWNGPEEMREKFMAGLKRILEHGATLS
jgi:hypothetical protein